MRHDCGNQVGGGTARRPPARRAESTCFISLAKVVRRCTIGNDNVPNVLAILSTTTINAFPLSDQHSRGDGAQSATEQNFRHGVATDGGFPAHHVHGCRSAGGWLPARV